LSTKRNIYFLFLSDIIFDLLIFVQFNNTISSGDETVNVTRAIRIWYWMV